MAGTVRYTKKGDVHTFETGLPAFEKIVIDQTDVPEEERGGVAKQLLACAALSCYTAALAGALDARGSSYTSITGEATLGLGPNEVGQGRVKNMVLEVRVDLPKGDAEIFNRCAKIMRQGCLVTGSLHEGMEVTYDLKPNFEE